MFQARSMPKARSILLVGALEEWPLAKRLCTLVRLPDELRKVSCYQCPVDQQKAAETHLFSLPETMSSQTKSWEKTLWGILAACSLSRASSELTWASGFHASAALEDFRKHAAKKFHVLSPAEALAARIPNESERLQTLEQELARVTLGVPKKKFLDVLAGKGQSETVAKAKGAALSALLSAKAEQWTPADHRLLSLWLSSTSAQKAFPNGLCAFESGFDRFGHWYAQLIAAGKSPDAAFQLLLREFPEATRWWPSTGVWVWEQLHADAAQLCARVLDEGRGYEALARVLQAVCWLPAELLDGAGRELLHRVCSDPALVPDNTMELLRNDATSGKALQELPRASRENT